MEEVLDETEESLTATITDLLAYVVDEAHIRLLVDDDAGFHENFARSVEATDKLVAHCKSARRARIAFLN